MPLRSISLGGENVRFGRLSQACFSLGAAAVTGNIVMTVSSVASNGLTFTVRAASIFWAGATNDIGGSPGTASDGNAGTFDAPKATIRACKNLILAASGSICYVRGTVPAQTGIETQGAALDLGVAGGATSPNVLIANWPGDAMPVIGQYTNSAQGRGVYNYNSNDHWVIAGFSLLAGCGPSVCSSALQLVNVADIRVVNNLLQCPAGNGSSGCMYDLYTANNPPMTQQHFYYGNEITNIGCGFGMTGGTDDSATLSGQIVSVPCNVSALGAGTVASSDGLNITLAGGTFNTTAMVPGDHLLINTNGDGTTYESRILSAVTSTTAQVSMAYAISIFTAVHWEYQNHISNKQYHPTYFGTDVNGITFGWNYVHNNSAIHGFNVHSTPGANTTLLSATAGTPAQITISNSVLGTLADGQYVEIVGNSTIVDNGYYVQFVSNVGTVENLNLFTDHALTAPYALPSNGTGGTLTASGFSPFNILAEGNIIDSQNGGCISLANISPSRGPVSLFNNLATNCGTGPEVNGSSSFENFACFYFLNNPDNGTKNLYGSRRPNCTTIPATTAAAMLPRRVRKSLSEASFPAKGDAVYVRAEIRGVILLIADVILILPMHRSKNAYCIRHRNLRCGGSHRTEDPAFVCRSVPIGVNKQMIPGDHGSRIERAPAKVILSPSLDATVPAPSAETLHGTLTIWPDSVALSSVPPVIPKPHPIFVISFP